MSAPSLERPLVLSLKVLNYLIYLLQGHLDSTIHCGQK